MHKAQKTVSRGFTLIELLIVIGIIGFLAAAVLVAVDPVKRIQDSRDARRYSEVNAVLNAILTKQVDDRALYNGARSGGIATQTGSNVQVLVSDATNIDCTAATTRPGCAKPYDTATTLGCVANVGGTWAGTGTISSSGTAVTGVGTTFGTDVKVGDTLSDGTNSCVVASIGGALALTCASAPTPGAFTGTAFTVTNAGLAVAPSYIAALPTDPAGGTPCGTGSGCTNEGDLSIGATNSGYYIARTTGNRIEIGACKPEQATSISVKR